MMFILQETFLHRVFNVFFLRVSVAHRVLLFAAFSYILLGRFA